MYKNTSQLAIDQFIFPYGKLDPDNRWVRMADLVPWDEVEKAYAEASARPARPRLSRPPKDPEALREDRRWERKAASDRNCVEGAFGAMKRAYGMDRVMTRLEETAIALSVLSFNLKRLAALLHALIWQLVAGVATLLDAATAVGCFSLASRRAVGTDWRLGNA